MQKTIIDTNVLVSALIQKSYPHLIVKEIFRNRDIQICISDELLDEYFNVLNRKKFSVFPDFETNAQSLLLDMEMSSKKYFPSVKLDVVSDKDDNKLLELAEIAKAHFLITGNHNDFTMPSYKTTRIVAPRVYWEEIIMKK